jgi:ATP-dependent RNA helicase DHX57
MGPNSGGGRRFGGGGHQRGQNEMSKEKQKLFDLKHRKASERMEQSSSTSSAQRQQTQKTRGLQSAQNECSAGSNERISMTGKQQDMIGTLISSLSVQRRQEEDSADDGVKNGTKDGTGLNAREMRVDVDQDDVYRKCLDELTKKKGFSERVSVNAMQSTEHLRASAGDLSRGFNEQRKRRVHRALDWLILNCPKEELPEQFRTTANDLRTGSNGNGDEDNGLDGDDDDDDDQGNGGKLGVRFEAWKELFFAGFGKKTARMACLNAREGIEEIKKANVALDDLLSAMSEPLKKSALKRAKKAFAESGLDDATKEQIEDILLDSRREELADIAGCDVEDIDDVNFAQFEIQMKGVVSLGKKKPSATNATLSLDFKRAKLYPFEPPRMHFTHPTLTFGRQAAITRALVQFSTSDECLGEPMLDGLIDWLSGDGPLDAMEKYRVNSEEELLADSDDDDEEEKNSENKPSIPRPKLAQQLLSQTERLKIQAERDVKFAEQKKAIAKREAQTQSQRDADDLKNMQVLGERIQIEEAKSLTLPKNVEASKQMKIELERKLSQHDPMMKVRERLPSWQKRHMLIEAIERNQVCVVVGETGCGKTTQLPQFVLDNEIARERGAITSIICTQPRRISATSVARRVAQERSENIGKTVGYSIRLEAKSSKDTKIMFCTTGVLLRRLTEDPLLAKATHIIVDEVHERSLDSDFLLVLLRDILPHRPTLKVILMSATLDAASFQRYFKKACVLTIPGFTHPVQDNFLEDVLNMTGYQPKHGSEYCIRIPKMKYRDQIQMSPNELRFHETLKKSGQYPEGVLHALRNLDEEKINYELCVELLEKIVQTTPQNGAILVFMPGLAEIQKTHEACAASKILHKATDAGKYLIALHSALATSESTVAFDRPKNDQMRKIIISTNIAETSITIDDVVYVIDSGKVKENGYDPNTRMLCLKEQWISRASAKQRRGRAGRVQPGMCFRLYSRRYHDEIFSDRQEAEIKRVPLEGLCLQIQLQRMTGGISGFLSRALEPPESNAVDVAVKTLKRLGALDERDNLTPLGTHLANLPVDVRVGKMLLYGTVLGCLDPTLTIAAVLGSRSPFLSPLEMREEADAAKMQFSDNDCSDHLTILNAYNAWRDAKNNGKHFEQNFCRDNFLSMKSLYGIAEQRTQFVKLLREAGFLNESGSTKASTRKTSKVVPKKQQLQPPPKKVILMEKKSGIPKPRGAVSAIIIPTPLVVEISQEEERTNDDDEKDVDDVDAEEKRPPAWEAANRHAKNHRLLKACLVAGLYPNVARVESQLSQNNNNRRNSNIVAGSNQPPPKLKYLAEDGKESLIQIHPSSINAKAKQFPTRWVVYHERVQTNSIYMRDCTSVTPYQLLLFGGKIDVQHSAGTLKMDGWATFEANARIGVLLKEIRVALDGLLREKIENPDVEENAKSETIVTTILQLLSSETE